MHLPLIMSLLLASSATNQLVVNETVESGVLWFFGAGVGVSVLCMAIIGAVHKSLDTHTSIFRFRRPHILSTRAIAGLALVFVPFAHEHINALQTLGIYVGMTGLLIVEEIAARLGPRELPERSDIQQDLEDMGLKSGSNTGR